MPGQCSGTFFLASLPSSSLLSEVLWNALRNIKSIVSPKSVFFLKYTRSPHFDLLPTMHFAPWLLKVKEKFLFPMAFGADASDCWGSGLWGSGLRSETGTPIVGSWKTGFSTLRSRSYSDFSRPEACTVQVTHFMRRNSRFQSHAPGLGTGSDA